MIPLLSSKLLTISLLTDLVMVHRDLADSEFANAVIPVDLEAASALIVCSSAISTGTLEKVCSAPYAQSSLRKCMLYIRGFVFYI